MSKCIPAGSGRTPCASISPIPMYAPRRSGPLALYLRVSRRRRGCQTPTAPRPACASLASMPSTETIAVFAVASLGLVAIPGPAVLYIVTRGVVHGRRGALVSVAGVECGNFVAVLGATVGLAAVISSSALAFSVVKYAGAAYLIYLGIRALREGAGGAGRAAATRALRSAPLLGGVHGRRPEPEAGPVPARLPASVRRPGGGPRVAADADPRQRVQRLRRGRRLADRARRCRRRQRAAPAARRSRPALAGGRGDLPRPRRSRGARRRPHPVGGMSGLEPPLQSAA